MTSGGGFKTAFSLAEVLITLGIIGVVSALLLPTVNSYFKVKKFETQFKTADSLIQQALKGAVSELGYDDIKDLHLDYYVSSLNENGGEPRRNLDALNDAWLKQFKGAKKLNPNREIYHRGVKTYSILGNEMPDPTTVFSGYLLPNGMFISRIGYNTNSAPPTCLKFYFDINGPYKGPNRFGHDIFHYYSVPYRAGCNPVRGISSREEGCYWYAHNNINPSKVQYNYTYQNGVWGYRTWFTTPANASHPDNYSDILYKPESYWKGE